MLMNSEIIKDTIDLLEQFSLENHGLYSNDISGFRTWIYDQEDIRRHTAVDEPVWEGKEEGRSVESALSTLLVHLNRYAKTYSKSAITDSDFSTQEDFIYLINLKAFGKMTKMQLIKKNVQEKPTGILIINRLIKHGWVRQVDSDDDKRTKILEITTEGLSALDQQMDKIRTATKIVTGDLSYSEKLSLVKLLDKLDHFHRPIFSKNINPSQLLDTVVKDYPIINT